MNKILASMMAASMVASICATASFAANTAAYADFDNGLKGNGTATVTYDTIRLTIDPDATLPGAVRGNEIYVVASSSFEVPKDATEADVAKAIGTVKFNDVVIDGKVYNLTLKQSGTTRAMKLTFSPAVSITGLPGASVTLETSSDGGKTFAPANLIVPIAFVTNGEGNETIETETDGKLTNVPVADVVKAYGDGYPVPLTENGEGVDKDLNGSDGVQSNKTVYFMIRDDEGAQFDRLEDDDYFKIKVTKGANGKAIKAISDVTKNFSGNLYDANTHAVVPGTGGARHRYIKVELNENFTDDEIKIGLDLRLTATQKAVDTNIVGNDSTSIKVKDFTFYMKNLVKTADNDWKVGIDGLMLNPLENDWNDVTYYDEDGDVAFMKFFGDSDIGKFYAKLSTKWEHADYAAYFNDQDAYYFEFTGSPKLSSTSRADLQIYNPFIDDDGNETFDATTATIYQVIDGDLIDVTDSFTYGEGENGDNAFITRTRFLGSYIICEKPVEEAAGDGTVDDLVPDDNETPTEVNPGNNNGGKAPASTGRYL